jgi:ribonuclease HI
MVSKPIPNSPYIMSSSSGEATNEPTELVAHIDGGSRGNPGPAAFAAVMKTVDGDLVDEITGFLGRTTNNVAEYQALLAALDYALTHRCRRLRVLADSELLVRQVNGTYKVKSPGLKPLYDRAKHLIAHIESFSIQHVYREQNREADQLANRTLDAAGKTNHTSRHDAGSDSRRREDA